MIALRLAIRRTPRASVCKSVGYILREAKASGREHAGRRQADGTAGQAAAITPGAEPTSHRQEKQPQ